MVLLHSLLYANFFPPYSAHIHLRGGWRSEKGELLDLTPYEGFAEKALFMPDGRAPFDILELKAPSSLYWWASGKYEWFFGHVRSQSFFIGRMDPKADQEARVDRTQQRYLHLA
jgi:hypothetical protein